MNIEKQGHLKKLHRAVKSNNAASILCLFSTNYLALFLFNSISVHTFYNSKKRGYNLLILGLQSLS